MYVVLPYLSSEVISARISHLNRTYCKKETIYSSNIHLVKTNSKQVTHHTSVSCKIARSYPSELSYQTTAKNWKFSHIS